MWWLWLGCSTPGTSPAPVEAVAPPRPPLVCPKRYDPSPTTRAVNALGVRVFTDHSVPNRAISPLSLATTLAMVDPGGTPQAQKTLGALRSPDEDQEALPCVVQRLQQPDAATSIALTFGLAATPPVQPAFQTLASHYWDAKSIAASPDGSIDVDAWVSEATHGAIPSILGAPLSGSEVAAVGVLHAKGPWHQPFPAADTQQETFHNANGTSSTVAMMHLSHQIQSTEDDRASLVGLRMVSSRTAVLELVVVLPKPGVELDALLPQLSTGWLDERIAAMDGWQMVHLTLPRFSTHHTENLRPTLTSIGAGALFGNGAFPGIWEGQPVTFDSALHGVALTVDEAGAEAAAATVMAGFGSAGPRGERTVRVDRPFLYVLRDVYSGVHVLIGRVDELP